MSRFTRTIVLGSSGMLGSHVFSELSRSGMQVLGFQRSKGFELDNFQLAREKLDRLRLSSEDLIVNCIGWIPQKSLGLSSIDAANATIANSLLPPILENISETTGAAVIQILTDCVFDGNKGPYSESSTKDARDVYGLSKQLGEIALTNTMGVRCSIVGKTFNQKASLLDWFLSQPLKSRVEGYTNHRWNGVTTKNFARLVKGVALSGDFRPGIRHWVPANSLTKYELLAQVQILTQRFDITLSPVVAKVPMDRRLVTNFQANSDSLWKLSGYNYVPTVSQLLSDFFEKDK